MTINLAGLILLPLVLTTYSPLARQVKMEQSPCTTTSSTAIAAELIAIERAIGDANIRRDREFFDKVEATEFLFTDSNGGLTNKAEDLAGLVGPRQPGSAVLETYVVDDTRVCVYGESATVWGRITTTGLRGDHTPYRNQVRFTDVFVRRDGHWQLVAGHASRLPAKP